MIENRAVGTNDDIHRRKHAPQGKKGKTLDIKHIKSKKLFYFFLFIFFLFYFF